MIQKEIEFKDGTRIFYEEANGRVQRVIEYALSPQEKEKIKNNPILKKIIESKRRKYNAGKYYYLDVLRSSICEMDDSQRIQLYNDLKNLHDRTSSVYDSGIINRNFFYTFGKYWPNNEHQCAAFFTTIYLAMVDWEQDKSKYSHSLGKTMVLKGCEAVILKGVAPKIAATMFERKHNNISDDYWEGNYEIGDSPYEKYNGYNGYDDDTIDIGFDGHPEATWNVD
jgi:hypothetical protein